MEDFDDAVTRSVGSRELNMVQQSIANTFTDAYKKKWKNCSTLETRVINSLVISLTHEYVQDDLDIEEQIKNAGG